MGNLVGYAHLINAMGLKAIGVKKPALVQPVTRIERINGALAVPQAVAPEAGDFLAHIIFALKHEGVNLSILAQALPRIEGQLLVEAITQSPSSGYLRKVCFLWEVYSGALLDYTDKPRGPASSFLIQCGTSLAHRCETTAGAWTSMGWGHSNIAQR